MDEAVSRKLLRLIGLGVRGRLVITGVDQVRAAAQRGTLALAVVAPDASRHSRDKVVPLLTARGVRIVEGPTSIELGHAVGRQAAAVVGVVDRQLARGMRELLETRAHDAR